MSQKPKPWRDPESGAPESVRSMLNSLDSSVPVGAKNRVWRELNQAPQRKKPLGLYLSLASAAAAALLVWLSPWQKPAELSPNSTSLAQIVWSENTRLGQKPLTESIWLKDGAQLHTGAQGKALLRLSQMGRLQLSKDSRFQVLHQKPRMVARLDAGELAAELNIAPEKPGMVLQAGDFELSVLAAKFSLNRLGAKDISIYLQSGRLLVEKGQQQWVLKAGDRFDSRERSQLAVKEETLLQAPPEPVVDKSPAKTLSLAERQKQLYRRASKARSKKQALKLFRQAAELKGPLTEMAQHRIAVGALSFGEAISAEARYRSLLAVRKDSSFGVRAFFAKEKAVFKGS